MNEKPAYPKYIRRHEETAIRIALGEVRGDRRSRAVLLYGPGGIGKTSLVRNMARTGLDDSDTIWIDPIDVDDPQYWMQSNLERLIVGKIADDGAPYFADYTARLARLQDGDSSKLSRETIVSYLAQLKRAFAEGYSEYIKAEKKTVVIIFDTVETIRGTNLMLTLTQWMKELPCGTLFILSGRPVSPLDPAGTDPIATELASPYQGIPFTPVTVADFGLRGTYDFLAGSRVGDNLTPEETDKLVRLSRGHPLWLAFMIDYLDNVGMPEEAEGVGLAYIERHLPFGGEMTREGATLHEAFLRRLVAPYRASDFWHEAIKRLAIVRQPVAKVVWQRLMADCELPVGVDSLEAAWDRLQRIPWIRRSGNYRYVTLHDAVAEEFSRRLFPMQDKDEQWRRRIWQRALKTYRDLVKEAESGLRSPDSAPDDVVELTVQTDINAQVLDLYKAATIYYFFLIDFRGACQELLGYFEQAEQDGDTYFQDLIVLYLQRFLPGGTPSGSFNDVIRIQLDRFRDWLTNEGQDYYVTLSILVARHLIDSAQPEAALRVLERFPIDNAWHGHVHTWHILRGNACMRIAGKVNEAIIYFDRALEAARALGTEDRHKYVAEAFKERGFYYRNTGEWPKADEAYEHAHATISAELSMRSSADDRDELASIQTHWAYIKGLNGDDRDGIELVTSAIAIRQRARRQAEEALSWSVCGEVHRYARRFQRAWSAYAQAEELLHRRRYWGRLGLIYQEQAICLYQADREGIRLTQDPSGDAKELITRALDICGQHAVRAYPSALNRAGRIYGPDDPEAGLGYLRKGIQEAQRLADGWFWFANLIEYAELNYRIWVGPEGEDRYRVNIIDLENDIEQAERDLKFPDLSGRWDVIQGHLAVHDFGSSGNMQDLDRARELYKRGFANIAKRNVGSSGASSISGQFKTFQPIFKALPRPVRLTWEREFRSSWRGLSEGSTLLLARLEDLY
jgi:tetratricopeptide (TPR) repeat protein